MKLKTLLLLTFAMFISSLSVSAQDKKTTDWAKTDKYRAENQKLMENQGAERIKAVFIGNSITQGWYNASPAFFTENGYIGRGIGGQVTIQFLARFNDDVIRLNPQIVVINGGINDIAENLGKYDQEDTFENIESMIRMAKANGIKVILTSVLPASKIPWRNIENTPEKVIALNKRIKEYAAKHNVPYVDYYSAMSNGQGGLKSEYTTDEVHVTAAGYKVMEVLITETINKLLLNN